MKAIVLATALAIAVAAPALAKSSHGAGPVASHGQFRNAHASIGSPQPSATTPTVSSMALDYANAYRFNGGASDPVCQPGGLIILGDGLKHRCQ